MKKIMIYILVALLALSLCSCGADADTVDDGAYVEPSGDVKERSEEAPVKDESGVTPEEKNEFFMIARITELGEKIRVEVIEGEYAFGTYLIITSDSTVITDSDGYATELSAGDTVRIVYNGQVMMSMPPQVVALKITKS